MFINLSKSEIDEIDVNKYKLIFVQDFFNDDNKNENYENCFLIINYVFTPMISYKNWNANLYPTKDEEDLKINKYSTNNPYYNVK